MSGEVPWRLVGTKSLMASRDRGRKGSGDHEWTSLGRNFVTEKRAERWVVAGGEYGVKEEFFLLFIFAMMKLC